MKKRSEKSMRLLLKAIAEDEASKEFQAIVKFRDIDGKYRSLSLPLSELEDIKALKKTLRNRGCHFSNDQDKTETALTNLANSTKDAERWKFAARTGWYDGHRQFVHPDGVIGRLRGDTLIKPPGTYARNHNSALQVRGSHEKWVEGVATPAQYSSRMILGICASLAAPLLDFAGLNCFGILVHGPGKAGKSTLLVVAGSVNGFGSERDLPNFRSTDAAFGEIPASFNDMLLPLNELGLLKGSTVERRQRIRDLSYGFAEGRGTTYSKFAPTTKSDADRKWRSIFLATGEEAIEQISEAAGHTRAVGEAIRWSDLRATHKTAEDIFDFCPDGVRNRKKWVRQQCVALRDASRAHRGVAFEHFIQHVTKCRKTIAEELAALTRQFVEKVTNEEDGHAVRHLATCFGHIAAAGVLGVRFGTVPWSKPFVLKCIRRCYRDARRALRTEKDLLHEGLRSMREGIDSKLLKVSRNKVHGKGAWKAAEGYREKTNHGIRVTIRGEAFKDWFADQRQAGIVLSWLHSQNALSSRRGPSGNSAPAITWAESQPLWPDGLRRRSIVLKLGPGVLSDCENNATERARRHGRPK
jgi:putative DNA primase/helicase